MKTILLCSLFSDIIDNNRQYWIYINFLRIIFFKYLQKKIDSKANITKNQKKTTLEFQNRFKVFMLDYIIWFKLWNVANQTFDAKE